MIFNYYFYIYEYINKDGDNVIVNGQSRFLFTSMNIVDSISEMGKKRPDYASAIFVTTVTKL